MHLGPDRRPHLTWLKSLPVAASDGQTYGQRRLAGRALRAQVPHSAHAIWEAAGRADPIGSLRRTTTPGFLAWRFDVQSIPTLLVLRGGR
jgi:hypothetical protein